MDREITEMPFHEEATDAIEQQVDELHEVLPSNILSDDVVKDYLRNIGKVPLLTAEQEVDLSKRIEAGQFAAKLLAQEIVVEDADYLSEELEWIANDGMEAKQHFITANTRLAVSIARKYQNRGLGMIDLIQEANLGLIKAVEKFDYEKGFKFSTYASWWIRQGLQRAIATQGLAIRVPVHTHEEIVKMRQASAELEKLGQQATPENIAKEMEVDVERVLDLQRWSKDPFSLDTPLGDDESGATIEDMVRMADDSIEESALFHEMRQKLNESFIVLNEREQMAIEMHFGLDDGRAKTYKEIGEVIGLSHERARQITSIALTKLRRNEHLREYVASAS